MIVTVQCFDGSLVSLLSNGQQNVFVEHSMNSSETKIKILRGLRGLGVQEKNGDIQDLPSEIRNGVMIVGNFLGLSPKNKLAIMHTPKGYVFRFFGLTKDLNETIREMKEEVREFV